MDFLYDIFEHHQMFIGFSVVYITLEQLFPIIKGQKFFRKEFSQDIFWYIFNNVFFERLAFLVAHYCMLVILPLWGRYIAYRLTPDHWDLINKFPLEIENPLLLGLLIFVLIDFFSYWVHYCQHRVPLMWNFHILHHSPTEIDWFTTASRTYWIDGLFSSLVTVFVLMIFKVPDSWLLPIAILNTNAGFLTHSNIRIRFGVLEKILNNTHAHWWHHDVECYRPYGQNFGHWTVIWDRLFGTYYVEEGYPKALGVSERLNYPKGVFARVIYPFIHPFKRFYSKK